MKEEFIKWLDKLNPTSKEYSLLEQLESSYHKSCNNELSNFFSKYDWIETIKIQSYFEDCDFDYDDKEVDVPLLITILTTNEDEINIGLDDGGFIDKDYSLGGYLYRTKNNEFRETHKYDFCDNVGYNKIIEKYNFINFDYVDKLRKDFILFLGNGNYNLKASVQSSAMGDYVADDVEYLFNNPNL